MIPEGQSIRTGYWHGPVWQDLCRGPHLQQPANSRRTPSS